MIRIWIWLLFFTEAVAAQNLPPLTRPFPDKLSAWAPFTVTVNPATKNLEPSAEALPYDLNNALFSDYAGKLRTIWMPAGMPAEYRRKGVFEFPVGTVISKTFYFPKHGEAGGPGIEPENRRLIETRLLVKTNEGWEPLPYVWNDEQNEAFLKIEGARVDVLLVREQQSRTISYVVPNVNQCLNCHGNMDTHQLSPIGPQASHLNKNFQYLDGRENQLDRWQKRKFLSRVPKAVPTEAVWNDPKTGNENARARAYLDINCAHCHRSTGSARTSGLYLNPEISDPETLGVMKRPVASGPGSGGLFYDIVPGSPDKSIFVYRMESVVPKVLMPELGRTVVDVEGVKLIRTWIEKLKKKKT